MRCFRPRIEARCVGAAEEWDVKRVEQSKLIWMPRVFAMALALFLMAFSLEAFSGEATALQRAAGFAMGVLPGLLVAGVAWLSWRRPSHGGWAAIALAAAFTVWFHTYRDIAAFSLLSLPLLAIGGLFLLLAKGAGRRHAGN